MSASRTFEHITRHSFSRSSLDTSPKSKDTLSFGATMDLVLTITDRYHTPCLGEFSRIFHSQVAYGAHLLRYMNRRRQY